MRSGVAQFEAPFPVHRLESRSNADDASTGNQPSEQMAVMQHGTDYEFRGQATTETSQESSRPKFEADFNQLRRSQSSSVASPPKFEADFNQRWQSSTSGPPNVAIEFNQKSKESDPKNAGKTNTIETSVDTRDGHDTEKEEDAVGTEQLTDSLEEEDAEEDELQVELEDESVQVPVHQPPPRILTHNVTVLRQRQSLVFGNLSVMVTEVSQEALLLPLGSPALSDMLQNRPSYRAIALRCGCELHFTRRVIVKKTVKWCRYAVLLLRGPSDAALKRFRACLEAANRAFLQAVPYDADRPRPRLLTSEKMPDNLSLAVCYERIGPATAAWEKHIPLEMPQRKLGKSLLTNKPPNLILPNNASVGPVMAYMYPKWGFQTSKPIPNTKHFQDAVDTALEMEKEQEKNFNWF